MQEEQAKRKALSLGAAPRRRVALCFCATHRPVPFDVALEADRVNGVAYTIESFHLVLINSVAVAVAVEEAGDSHAPAPLLGSRLGIAGTAEARHGEMGSGGTEAQRTMLHSSDSGGSSVAAGVRSVFRSSEPVVSHSPAHSNTRRRHKNEKKQHEKRRNKKGTS